MLPWNESFVFVRRFIHLKYSHRFTPSSERRRAGPARYGDRRLFAGTGRDLLGSTNNIPGLIDVLNLPEYTYPVLGLAIGKPDQNPTVKPRMPHTMQFFENTYWLTPMAYSTSCPPSTRKFTGTTICAKPTVRWTPSAIRSPTISRQDKKPSGHCSTRPPLRASV